MVRRKVSSNLCGFEGANPVIAKAGDPRDTDLRRKSKGTGFWGKNSTKSGGRSMAEPAECEGAAAITSKLSLEFPVTIA